MFEGMFVEEIPFSDNANHLRNSYQNRTHFPSDLKGKAAILLVRATQLCQQIHLQPCRTPGLQRVGLFKE